MTDLNFNFNPRSREGSDRTAFLKDCTKYDFNPRSREGSDWMWSIVMVVYIISIRAPARGATIRQSLHPYSFPISIRAPARGATLHTYGPDSVHRFQSALPRGERRKNNTNRCYETNFNPRSREGSDISMSGFEYEVVGFQSALPRGERRNHVLFSTEIRDFNPRSREGSDAAPG